MSTKGAGPSRCNCGACAVANPKTRSSCSAKLADFQFLIVTLRRLRRAALIATNVASAADEIQEAIARFDTALPGLATMRNVAEHIDDYALDRATRHHRGVNRRMLQVASWDENIYRWLGINFDLDAALSAAQQLFHAVRDPTVLTQAEPASDAESRPAVRRLLANTRVWDALGAAS